MNPEEMLLDEMIKCFDLQNDILKIAEDEGLLAAIDLKSYPMTLALREDTVNGQMELFPRDRIPGSCCISFRDNALTIETNGELYIAEDVFTKILRKFKKCCVEFALETHREMYEGIEKAPD